MLLQQCEVTGGPPTDGRYQCFVASAVTMDILNDGRVVYRQYRGIERFRGLLVTVYVYEMLEPDH